MMIQELYKKVTEFEASISSSTKSSSQCQLGCSRCCYVDLSVFEIEAENIREWFKTLDRNERTELLKQWETPPREQVNFHGEKVQSCAFLLNERCSIYAARPLICRTQGLGFTFIQEAVRHVDICPLNEPMLESITQEELLDLDRLNLILAKLEHNDAKGIERPRTRLGDLKGAFGKMFL